MIASLDTRAGILIDTNLLVLYVVGSVNQDRIATFKRTSQYTAGAFELLCRVLDRYEHLYTVPHVLAEVSNLTDLRGSELSSARELLKGTVELLREVPIPSKHATSDTLYTSLGLADAAIAAVARAHACTVFTDDLQLYLRLTSDQIPAINFAHLLASEWKV